MQNNDFLIVQSKKKTKNNQKNNIDKNDTKEKSGNIENKKQNSKTKNEKNIITIEKEYPLLRKWNLGHINGKKMPKQNCSPDVFAKSLNKIGSFDDVLTMWSYFNHIDITLLGLNSCLYVFEDNILPMWEDKNNIGGNIYKSYICEEYIYNVFIKILLLVIGEIFGNDNGEKIESPSIIAGSINGLYVKKSFKTYEFQIWTKKNSKNITDILSDITEMEWKCISIH